MPDRRRSILVAARFAGLVGLPGGRRRRRGRLFGPDGLTWARVARGGAAVALAFLLALAHGAFQAHGRGRG